MAGHCRLMAALTSQLWTKPAQPALRSKPRTRPTRNPGTNAAPNSIAILTCSCYFLRQRPLQARYDTPENPFQFTLVFGPSQIYCRAIGCLDNMHLQQRWRSGLDRCQVIAKTFNALAANCVFLKFSLFVHPATPVCEHRICCVNVQ